MKAQMAQILQTFNMECARTRCTSHWREANCLERPTPVARGIRVPNNLQSGAWFECTAISGAKVRFPLPFPPLPHC
jgi:hypothetical protein